MPTLELLDQDVIVPVEALTAALSVPDGGFTVDTVTGERPRWGYAVSIFPELSRVIESVQVADLVAYMIDHEETLGEPSMLLGGWRDPVTGLTHLDVSVRVRDRSAAERLARRHQQIAYFDLAAGASVSVIESAA